MGRRVRATREGTEITIGRQMPARVRLCARCRNHNEKNLVKDHKDQCKYRDCKCENCILILQRQQVQGKLKRLQSSESTSRRGATTRVQSNSTNQKNHPQELHRRLRYQHVPPQQQVDTARHLQYQFRAGSNQERSTVSSSLSSIRSTFSEPTTSFGPTFSSPSLSSFYLGLPLQLQLLDSSLGLSLGAPFAGPLAALGHLASLNVASQLAHPGTSGNSRTQPSLAGQSELSPGASTEQCNIKKKS
ncbi:doublesex- and mab-3-related transcription factor 3a-like isoform X2 [Varroa destructor]|uniref:DM domain-containing protein n=1 Tax=Varroa destructor TaxID=109461 RepID=A0A7M7KSQ7_VARDE|nr:doublesex- and mab-3-related transcription factor 3a-like isoform X2 [Varroa destructor]